jgi:hypothetical protein
MTTLISLDTQSSQLLFNKDEELFCSHLESLSDQIIELSTESCELTKPFRPQMGLKFIDRPMDSWQSPYFRNYISKPMKNVIANID